MADEIVQLSPEQKVAYNAAAQPTDINPLRDLDANQIFELAVQDPDNFDIAAEFSRQPELHADASQVQKAADALHLLRQRGFKLADLPGPRKIAGTAVDIAKGFGKQALNYLTAGVNVGTAAVSDVLGGDSGTSDALLQESQRRVAENIAGTESAVTGLSGMVQRAAGKIGRGIGALTNKIFRPGMVGRTIGLKPLEEFTPEDKVKELFDAAGKVQNQQEIAQGKGAFLTGVGGEVVKELEQAGKPVRPEEVAALAPGDPFSWWTFGKALGQTGRLVPSPVKTAAARVGETLGEAATVAGGKSIQALGAATRLTAKGVEKAAPAVGLLKGAAEAGPLGALAGLKAGELVRPITRRLGAAGAGLAQVGKDIAATGVAPTAAAQLGRDVIQSIPGVAGGAAHGAAMDIGLAAVTSESPAETEASVGLGATLGGLGGVRRAGQRILSGQLIAPRAWGSNTPVPSSGNFKPLDALHAVAYATAAPAVRERVNAIRQFVKGSAPGTDVFLGKDSASIEKALTDSGVDPATAKQFADQEGFFTADLGGGRKVVVVKNVEAAPHEAFHAFQDVLGEQANRAIDQIIKDNYADRWDAEGQKYAQRLTGAPVENWRDVILDASGWGHAEAIEKLSREAGNKIRNETGAEPDPEAVADLVRGAWSQSQGNPREAWREILTPEEQAATADRYIARELAAENFDAVFKNLGASLQDQPGVIPALARIVGKTVEALGGEPLAGRTSEFGAVPLRTPVVEAVRGAVNQRRLTIAPTPEVALAPRAPVTPAAPAEEAKTIADEATDNIPAGGTKSPRELLGSIAEAIAQQSGVKINYLSAPGEPAAATTSNRAARREIIETFRTMPAAARALWEKTFFPERIFKRKDKYQIFGWSPEVFASNAHKMAAALKDTTFSPYEIDPTTGSFTEKGWQELFADTQKFVQNQMAGQTGAGEALVVPRTSQPGIFAPASRPAEAVPLDQTKADFVNMLFNSRLPETPRLTKGKPSLNIAGQEVSEATKPGRVQKPVIGREPFAGLEAEARGIAGREILEVNPLRNQITAALGDKMPSLIEANQLLNLENIKEVTSAPEQPQFRANTLTLAAGFQPAADRARELLTMSPEEWKAATDYKGKFGAGFTGFAYEIGSSAKTKEDLQAIRETYNTLQELGRAAMDAKDIQNAMSFVYRGQAAREAYEAATGETLDGRQPATAPFIRQHIDPSYNPPMPGEAFKRWEESQKALDIPPESGIFPEMAAQPKKAKDPYKFPTSSSGGIRKAWVLPTGEVEQLGGTWHHDWIAQNPAVAKKYGLDKFESDESIREEALKKGFIRVNNTSRDGNLIIEGRAKDWRKVRTAMENLVESNIDDIDNVTVHLFDDKIQKVVDSETRRLFVHETDADKLANLPFSEHDPRGTGVSGQFQPKETEKLNKAIRKVLPGISFRDDVVLETSEFNTNNAWGFGGGVGTSWKLPNGYEVRKGTASFRHLPDEPFLRFRNPNGHGITKSEFEEATKEFFTGKEISGQAQPKAFEDELEKVRTGQSGGQTFNPDGTVWEPTKSDLVTLASVNLPAGELTREAFEQATEPYKALLAKPGIVAGVFSFSKEGKPTVSIDINAVVPKEFRENSVQFAKDNDQVAIWDAEKFEEVKTGGKGNTRLSDPDDLAIAAESLMSGEPINLDDFTSRAAQQDFFSGTEALSNSEVGRLSNAELKRRYPEAIVPASKEEKIPSEIVNSPLYKSAGTEAQAVKAFSRRLVEFAKEWSDRPEYKLGAKWYSEFVPKLKQEFGADASIMAELLAATSPQTNVETNFGYALDALESMKAGRFNKIIDKYNQGLDMLANDKWQSWYKRNLKDIPNPPAEPTPAAFLAHWIETHNLKPRQSNGKLYGQHSLPVLQVLARRWLDTARGPKTLNFVQNLLGTGHEATIDLWADRTMRRIGYEGYQSRWRILPHNNAAVSDADFSFAQQAFRQAAKELGMKPDALQGALWFAEKSHWADKGWSRLSLGDFSREMEKVPMLRAGYRQRLDKTQRAAKVKPVEEQELLIQPRKTK